MAPREDRVKVGGGVNPQLAWGLRHMRSTHGAQGAVAVGSTAVWFEWDIGGTIGSLRIVVARGWRFNVHARALCSRRCDCRMAMADESSRSRGMIATARCRCVGCGVLCACAPSSGSRPQL